MAEPDIKQLAQQAEDAARHYVQQRLPTAKVFSFGAVEIDPVHFAIWIATESDAQCRVLEADAALLTGLRDAIARAGYPAEAVPHVGFAFASQETVDRDYGGDWWSFVK